MDDAFQPSDGLALYQGTTLVVPQLRETTMGFSP
jgi:hypothetical protein